MRIFKGQISIPLAAVSIPLCLENAWALYAQPAIVTGVNWIMAIILVLLPAYIFLKVGFVSSIRFRFSLALVILNLLALLAAPVSMFYIVQTIEGFESLAPLGVVGSVLSFLWFCAIPFSVFLICLLSKQAKKMLIGMFFVFILFCITELGLNYAEINRYLSAVENSNYKDFKHSTDIRNYLSASGIEALRLYPRVRTKRVVLAMLKSNSWVDWHDAACGLQYLKDPTVIPYLIEALHIQDADDRDAQARRECAVALQMLLSGNYDLAIYKKVEVEYKENPTKLFERIQKDVKQNKW